MPPNMSSEIMVIKTTLPEEFREFEVTSFSQSLVGSGASCVTHHLVTSTYEWEGEIISNKEWSLSVKLSKSKTEDVIDKIKQIHPYEIPQLLFSSWNSSPEYYSWIESN